MAKRKNPLVFLDVCIDGDPIEKLVFELFYDVAPNTAENFRALCTGEKGIGPRSGKPLHYKGSFFHRIAEGYLAQGGDFVNRNGTGGESIYAGKFPDEMPKLKHDGPGLLSMPLADRDSLGSHFSITFSANHGLDRKHVVFGKLVDGHEVLKKIENAGDKDGNPTVTVKIIYCGEYEEKRKLNHDAKQRAKHKKSSRYRKRRRRRHYSSDSESSSDTESESSDTDSDSDSSLLSSSSDAGSSSDDKRKRRKKLSRKDKQRRGKRRDKRRDRKHRRRDKRSKRKARKLDAESSEVSDNEKECASNDDDLDVKGREQKDKKETSIRAVAEQYSPKVEKNDASVYCKRTNEDEIHGQAEFPQENGEQHSNGTRVDPKFSKSADRQPDIVNDHPGKSRSRSRSLSPKRPVSKSMSISPQRNLSKSPKRSLSRSPRPPQKSRSISRSPVRANNYRSPNTSWRDRSVSGSPTVPLVQKNSSWRRERYSPSHIRSPGRSLSKSPIRSPRRSLSRSPMRSLSRSISRSPVRSPSRSPIKQLPKSTSRERVRAAGNQSRSPITFSRRSISASPKRELSRTSYRSYSRSRSPVHRVRSPGRRRSLSRSASPYGSPKRVRRGRGFSQQYSYARRYRTPSRSPVRSYRYSSRNERERYPSRRYSPRRYRSPPRGKTPLRYRSRRSRTPSVSRSPRFRHRRYSRSPVRARSPVETAQLSDSPRPKKRRSPSRSRSLSASRSPMDSPPRRQNGKSLSRSQSSSSSGSLHGKRGLVSYGDGSP